VSLTPEGKTFLLHGGAARTMHPRCRIAERISRWSNRSSYGSGPRDTFKRLATTSLWLDRRQP
jgi:hypothetical protein